MLHVMQGLPVSETSDSLPLFLFYFIFNMYRNNQFLQIGFLHYGFYSN